MFIHALNGIGAQYINVQSIADRRNALIVSPTPPLNFAITTWTGAYDYVADTMTCGTGIHLIHIWLPHVFKQIYRHVLARENRDSIPVYFTGFSAGAQCVTRYMLVRQFFPDSIPIKMAVSMSPAGYIFGTDIFNDSTMVFPFGLAKGSVGSEWDCKTSIYDTLDLHFLCNEHVVQYYNENYGVMVGTLDTAAYGWWPLTIEGYSRYERAKNFYNFSDTNAITRGTTLKWVYDTVPGVGHAGATLYSTTATGDSIPIVERVLFDTPWHPVPNSALAIDFSSDKNIVSLPNATVQFYNNTLNATSYLWDFGDGYGSTVVNPSHTYASVDTFTVKLTASSGSGCTYTLTKKYYIIVKSGMGVNESTMYDARCTIYPNPTSGVFNVQMSQFENLKMKDIEIYNMYGEKVPAHFQINSSSNSQIDLSSPPAGIYFIELNTSKGNYHGKVVKE